MFVNKHLSKFRDHIYDISTGPWIKVKFLITLAIIQWCGGQL